MLGVGQPDRHGAQFGEPTCAARARLVRRAQGLLGLRVLRLEIGRHRAKSVQQSVDAVARAANGQSERPLERGIGCNSDVPHARVEDRARGTAENTDQVVVRVKDGTMLVFPAYLQHSVDASASEEERISISFNIMFSSFTKNLSKPLW